LYTRVQTSGQQTFLELVIVVNDTRSIESTELKNRLNPAILLFEVDEGVYRLPGGNVSVGEGDEEAIHRIFKECFGVTDIERGKLLVDKCKDVIDFEQGLDVEKPSEDRILEKQRYEKELLEDRDASFAITDVLFTTYRPHFDNITYPYLAPHIKRPKQTIKTIVLELDASKRVLGVPKNVKLVSVPLFEIFGNKRFGGIEKVVWGLSRFLYHQL
jgi:hypothetical protein